MAAEALAKAREIAARLTGGMASELGKRKMDGDQNGVSGVGLGFLQKKKIYIPKSDNPELNFLGLLIGPKGITQKQMQESTGAKILFRGKGSSKDTGTINTGHPDDNDELHVSIEGSAEAVEKATKEVEQIIYNPEQALKLKQEQLKHVDTGSDSIYGPSGGSGSSSSSEEMRVPNNMVGLVIGRGGENIHRIQATLAVHAQIQKEHEMQPGETHRLITLKGPPAGIVKARARIQEIIDAQYAKLSGATTGFSTSMNEQPQLNNAFVVMLPVPNDKVGIIIGRGGMTVKAIQERSRAQVQIPPGPDADNHEVRTLSIGGDTKESVDAAQMEIFMALRNYEEHNSKHSPDALNFQVPHDRVGLIIGKGGATCRDIQNRLKVKLVIPQVADEGVYPLVRTIGVIGDPENQKQAKYEIEMLLAGTPVTSNPTDSSAAMGGMYGAGSYGNAWGQQGMMGGYGMQQQQQYGYYGMQYGDGYYDATAQQYAAQQPVAAASAESDPTAYYNDFWQYAAYYGEALARSYYGAWSPPEGTPPPPGITLPTEAEAAANAAAAGASAAADTTAAQTTAGVAASSGQTTVAAEPTAATTTAGSSEESDAEAWEKYKKEYAEWYEAHGKALGADPNPPEPS